MTDGTLQIQALDADALAANQRWWEIYEECFPFAGERERPEAIIASVRSGAGLAYHARLDSGTIAIARTHELSEREDFLAYLGVTAAHRRQGVGEQVFRALRPRSVIFEVQDPEHAAIYGSMPEACRMRIAWYERHFRAGLLDQPYLQPPLVAGTDAFPLRLMWTGGPLDREQTLRLVWRLYERFYHQANGVPLAVVRKCYARGCLGGGER